jgi:hypothetical protein
MTMTTTTTSTSITKDKGGDRGLRCCCPTFRSALPLLEMPAGNPTKLLPLPPPPPRLLLLLLLLLQWQWLVVLGRWQRSHALEGLGLLW